MVAKEMMDELRSIRRNFEWKFDGRSRKIRGRLKSQPNSDLFDPIGAVCYSRTGLVFDDSNWFRAAEEIGLTHIDAGDLTAAANNAECPQYADALRRQMIDTVLLLPEKQVLDSEVPNAFVGFVTTLFRGHAKPNVMRVSRAK